MKDLKGLELWFSKMTKDQLKNILGVFEVKHCGSLTKDALVTLTAEYICNNPELWLSMLSERDLVALNECILAGPEIPVPFSQPDYPLVPLFLGLVYSDPSMETITIPECMYSVIEAWVGKVMEEKKGNGSFRKDRLILGILNTYGAIRLDDFPTLLQKCFPARLLMEKATDIFGSLIVKMCLTNYNGIEWLVSPYIMNMEGYVAGVSNFRKYRAYARHNESDFMAAASNIPFCAAYSDREEAESVIKMFKGLGLSRESALQELHYIWLHSQYLFDDEIASHIFDSIEDLGQSMLSFEQYRDCLQTITDYANSVPKWYLKGRSANECNMMKISLHSREDDYNEFQEIAKYMNFGMAVPRVGPYEPCPCGSGLSYCNCHGKFVN